ncbi:MAG: ribulokinase, partial [Verrucomicrobiota bacterium]
LASLQKTNCRVRDRVYHPDPENQKLYARLFALYRQVHDAFGTAEWSGSMNEVMKQLITLREEARTTS